MSSIGSNPGISTEILSTPVGTENIDQYEIFSPGSILSLNVDELSPEHRHSPDPSMTGWYLVPPLDCVIVTPA